MENGGNEPSSKRARVDEPAPEVHSCMWTAQLTASNQLLEDTLCDVLKSKLGDIHPIDAASLLAAVRAAIRTEVAKWKPPARSRFVCT